MYLPEIISNFDVSGCYYRIIKAITAIHAQQAGATINTVCTSCLVRHDTKQKVKTAHGISSIHSIGGLLGEEEGQGQGIVNDEKKTGTLTAPPR